MPKRHQRYHSGPMLWRNEHKSKIFNCKKTKKFGIRILLDIGYASNEPWLNQELFKIVPF